MRLREYFIALRILFSALLIAVYLTVRFYAQNLRDWFRVGLPSFCLRKKTWLILDWLRVWLSRMV